MEKLRNKRVLITAGPTWVPIDKVRVISNIATGQTGILLAENLIKAGAKVTLLSGPAQICCLNKKVKLIPFRFFDELKNKLIKEIKDRKYDIVIHAAAVSDYRPLSVYNKKIRSGMKNLTLKLVPTVKIINLIKKADPSLFLVGFKYEPAISKAPLLKKARDLMRVAHLDLAVANTVYKNSYLAYIVGRQDFYGPLKNKKDMAKGLIRMIGEKYERA